MAAEREEAARELRLEGAPLFIVGAMIVASICAAFFAGRWVERRAHASVAMTVADEPGPLSQVVEPRTTTETTADADFFDRVDRGSQAEPQREARRPSKPSPAPVERVEETDEPAPREVAPPTARSTTAPVEEPRLPAAEPAAPAKESGSYFVQVFAGHDRAAARKIIDRLEGEGYEVRLFDETGEGGAILRVRVGGYPSEDRARTIAGNLRRSGYADAFVTRAD